MILGRISQEEKDVGKACVTNPPGGHQISRKRNHSMFRAEPSLSSSSVEPASVQAVYERGNALSGHIINTLRFSGCMHSRIVPLEPLLDLRFCGVVVKWTPLWHY